MSLGLTANSPLFGSHSGWRSFTPPLWPAGHFPRKGGRWQFRRYGSLFARILFDWLAGQGRSALPVDQSPAR
ncbi:hypothetical protein FJ976_07625 [Mesorhizobium sp. B1-1-9]|nr:hypothetical protein FJ978_06250 [Mesorhizobium sp. B1-1-7]TPN55637.1 hypothetical protein FJ976_07625 [Mesorhizobium sp. B1-1-9]